MAKLELKPWELTEDEDFSSFQRWRSNILLCLSVKDNFAPFLKDGVVWNNTEQHRGLIDDLDPTDKKTVTKSAETKAGHLDQMLRLIARWVPQYLCSDIVDKSTSMDTIWVSIRKYYGLKRSEVNFIQFLSISRKPRERPQTLFRRLLAHVEDNLLNQDSDLKHDGKVGYNEMITPTIERLVLLRWMELLHPGLPELVSTKMAFDLQTHTLKDIHDQVCHSLDSFLAELMEVNVSKINVNATPEPEDEPYFEDYGQVSYSGAYPPPRRNQRTADRQLFARPNRSSWDPRMNRPWEPRANRPPMFQTKPASRRPSCRICLAEGRPYFHPMSRCDYLSKAEKQEIAQASMIAAGDDEAEYYTGETVIGSVDIVQPPSIFVYHDTKPVRITLDTGASSSLMSLETAERLNLRVIPTSQRARQADHSNLNIVGEIHVSLSYDSLSFKLSALVAKGLHCQVLVGMPFMKLHDIVLDIPCDRAIVRGKYTIPTIERTAIRDSVFYSVSSVEDLLLHPGDSIILTAPPDMDNQLAVEPLPDLEIGPEVVTVENGELFLTNESDAIVSIHRNRQLAHVHNVHQPTAVCQEESGEVSLSASAYIPTPEPSKSLIVDPTLQWTNDIRQKFEDTVVKFQKVFGETIGKYNDADGRIRAHITIGNTLPPKAKAIVPSYESKKLALMQSIMDDLEAQGVLAKPEDVGVVVDQVSPSFLIPKKAPNEFRLVTSFNRLSQYVKPPPSRPTSTENVLMFLSRWKHVIKTDMAKQFYQLPLDKESMRYVGTMTPYKGLRVYCRAAMGMPGSSENLDYLTSRVLGCLLHKGTVEKIADDIYIGGNSADELLANWTELLAIFEKYNLRLSASKTVINPQETVILGWTWRNGTISPSKHSLNTLAGSDLPTTIQGLRSWLGKVKHIKHCIKGYSYVISPLEAFVGGKVSKEKIEWTDSLRSSFRQAQNNLKDAKTLTIPRPDDHLVIITDGAVKTRGIGATLNVKRGEKILLGGFFSAKIPPYQSRWLPCEVEGLAISAAVKYWSNFIRESNFTTQILTDSKPCVQAYNKLCRGEFSSKGRICAFLSSLADVDISMSHISGIDNGIADHQSRNAVTCRDMNCQVCQFISEEAVVSAITVDDILSRKVSVPFTSPQAWRDCQRECPHLRHVFGYLDNGIRPNRKSRESSEVKRYLQHASIGDGKLIIVRTSSAMRAPTNLIVVPQNVVKGLLTALHLKLNHPSKAQLRRVFDRSFYALDIDEYVKSVTDACAHCAALKTLPKETPTYSTSEPSKHPGMRFSADVLRRSKQCIFVLRENFSSYTTACLVNSEKREDLREAILRTVIPLKFSDTVLVRTDPAPGFVALKDDPQLLSAGINLDIGDRLNINKNPIAEKAIREFENELKISFSRSEPVTDADIQKTIKTLNNRIRSRDITAEEILFQRNVTGEPITLNDEKLRQTQLNERLANHKTSSRSKVPFGPPTSTYYPEPGDLVFVKNDGSKHNAREQYIVIAKSADNVQIRKLCGNMFRAKLYGVKITQIFPVPFEIESKRQESRNSESDSSDSDAENEAQTRKSEARASRYDETFDEDEQLGQDNLEQEAEYENRDDFPFANGDIEYGDGIDDSRGDDTEYVPPVFETRTGRRTQLPDRGNVVYYKP